MNKTVFMFPGVGSQYVGMGESFYNNFKIYKDTIDEAGEVLQTDLVRLSFSPGNKAELDRLENAQVALVAFSTAAYRVFRQEIGIEPDFFMGHSLGEYSALCAAGVIRFPDALRLVKERGAIINDVSSRIDGTMAWVINIDAAIVDAVCKNARGEGREVYISADDSPFQASISGHTAALMKVARELESKGAIVYPLRLSGPFHSPLMQEAADRMKQVLEQYQYKPAGRPVIANRNARAYNGIESVADNLALQLSSPVLWRPSLETLLKEEVGIAIEMGPKNVLKFLVKKNTDLIKPFSIDKVQDLELIEKELQPLSVQSKYKARTEAIH